MQVPFVFSIQPKGLIKFYQTGNMIYSKGTPISHLLKTEKLKGSKVPQMSSVTLSMCVDMEFNRLGLHL